MNIMKRQPSLYIVVVLAAIVIMFVNPYITQFSTATRSHHIQNRMKTPTGLSGCSNSSHRLSSSSSPSSRQSVNSNNNNKFVIINFDDSHESDYTYAKPVLDKYRFKATFFEVCDWIEAGYHDKDISITWQQIAAL